MPPYDENRPERIEKVAVLGAGTMGARIAAHLANAGVPCWLLDIVPSELTPEEKSRGLSLADPRVRNRIVRAGLDAALKARPAAFFTPAIAARITIGNFEDNLAWCAEADWIIEAVAENLEIKRQLLDRVAARSPPRRHRHHQHLRPADPADRRWRLPPNFRSIGPARISSTRRVT